MRPPVKCNTSHKICDYISEYISEYIMWIKIGQELRQIPDKQWEAYLANTLIKCPEKPKDNSKIKKALGYTWYLDDEKK